MTPNSCRKFKSLISFIARLITLRKEGGKNKVYVLILIGIN